MSLSRYHSPTSVGSWHQTGGASLRLPSYLAPPLQRARGQVDAALPEAATCLNGLPIAGGQRGKVIRGQREAGGIHRGGPQEAGKVVSGPQEAGKVVSGQSHDGRSPTVPSRVRPRTRHEPRVRPNNPSRDARSTTMRTLPKVRLRRSPQVPNRVQRSTRHGPRASPRTRS